MGASILFTPSEWAAARQRRQHAQLVQRGLSYERGGLAKAQRLFVIRDEDGNPVGRKREYVCDGDVPIALTVLTVEDVDVYGDTPVLGRSLSADDARACGCKTLGAMRDVWRAKHPRSDFATLVWFTLGDHRDRDMFMSFTGQAGGDYTFNARRAMDRDAPALTADQYANLGMAARQRDLRRKADSAKIMGSGTAAERMARVERIGQMMGLNLAEQTRALDLRTGRVERKLGIRAS